MSDNDIGDNVSTGRLVETLFGLVEERVQDEEVVSSEDEENGFDEGGLDLSQADLPLAPVDFYAPKIITQEKIQDLIPFLDELSLFENQWGFVKKSETRENWCLWARAQAVPILEHLTDLCIQNQLIQPRALYSYVHCAVQDETLYLYKPDKKEVFLEMDFPRLKNGTCLTDKIVEKEAELFDTIAVIAVNLGRGISETGKSWLASGKKDEYAYLNGFALEMLNAMTRYTASLITDEGCCLGNTVFLGDSKQASAKVQSALVDMLNASLIDITFSRNYLMMPEYSSLALVLPR